MSSATEMPVQLGDTAQIELDDTAQIAEPQEGITLPIFGNVVLPQDADVLNGILASTGLQSADPEVAIAVFLLVFILVIAVCRSRRCQAVSRWLVCRAAANRGRGSHQAVSTREEAEHSGGSDEESAPRRQRKTKRRRARPQPNGTRRSCDTELDPSELATANGRARNERTPRDVESAAAHALADSLQNTFQIVDEVEAEVEEATDSEAEAGAATGML